MSLLATTWVLLLGSASAQDATAGEAPPLNVDLFSAPADPRFGFVTDDSRGGDRFQAAVWAQWFTDPVLYEAPNGEVTSLLSDGMGVHTRLTWSRGRFRVGGALPLYYHVDVDDSDPHGAALGDASADLRFVAVEGQPMRPGVGATARLAVPLGGVEWMVGSQAISGELGLVADFELGPIALLANGGVLLARAVDLEGSDYGSQLTYRGGVAWARPEGARAGLSAELFGRTNLATFGSEPGPLEIIPATWVRVGPVVLRAAVGIGVAGGLGAPAWRGVLGFSWALPESEAVLSGAEPPPVPAVPVEEPPPVPAGPAEEPAG